jgi:single-strand DNA-binding protein
MQIITISGNLGRDAELRSTQNGDKVLSFSVGVRQGFDRDTKSEWFRCLVWGKRAESISQYLLKGVRVSVVGTLKIGEYQGRPQYDVSVNEVEWERRQGDAPHQQSRGGGGGSTFDADLDDSVPFISCDPRRETRAF